MYLHVNLVSWEISVYKNDDAYLDYRVDYIDDAYLDYRVEKEVTHSL